MNKSKLLQNIKAHLDKVGHGIDFQLITAGVRQEENWWQVPVLATRNGKDVPREIMVNIFANVEDELETEEGITVLFIPAVAEVKAAKTKRSA